MCYSEVEYICVILRLGVWFYMIVCLLFVGEIESLCVSDSNFG